MSPPVRLLAIRHAPVAVEGIFYGQTDVPTRLNTTDAADRIEHSVARFAPAIIWSSDAVRCRVADPVVGLATRDPYD